MSTALPADSLTAHGFAYWAAGAIFVVSFALIISEKVHKTKVALAGAAATLLLSLLSQDEAFYSPDLGIDYNVICLLIAMMVMVHILGRSGAFEWTAVKIAKLGRGRPLRIMMLFFAATALFSAFLDNVTTVLLFAPVALLVADELEIDSAPFLIGEALASNIGGTATLIGDPPNLMIGSRAKLDFMAFVNHLGPAVVVMMFGFLAAVWLFFRGRIEVSDERRQHILAMREDKLIKDPLLAKKAVLVLGLTTIGFVLHGYLHYQPATVALAGAAVLLLISRLEPHEVLAAVEWPTIFFFIGLYVIIGGVVKAGIISDVSRLVIELTHPTASSMFATSIVVLWFSAALSGFVDNIPYVATMAPLVLDMAGNVFGSNAAGGGLSLDALHHPVLMPVWWSLALGACLGGNASPIGASANVVVLGIAERSGRHVGFLRFMLYGVPVTLLTMLIASFYVYVRYY